MSEAYRLDVIREGGTYRLRVTRESDGQEVPLAEVLERIAEEQERLAAENERLREALESIASNAACPYDGRNAYEANTTLDDLEQAARAALAEGGGSDG